MRPGRVAVLGEGRTEQFYLKHLKAIKGYNYAIRPLLFDSISLKDATEIIDQLLHEGFGLIVFFMDFDTIVNQQRMREFNAFKKRYAKRKEVLVCESMPSIEYWFLLHFTKTTREFENSDQVVASLKRFIADYSKKIDWLEQPEWVTNLCANGKLSDAINRSKEVLAEYEHEEIGIHFPFTKVHLGIETMGRKLIHTP